MTARTVWKCPITFATHTPTRMPAGSRLLWFDRDPTGTLAVWIETTPGAPEVARDLHVVGTGHPVPEGATYVGTAIDGLFVWHLYDAGEVPL